MSRNASASPGVSKTQLLSLEQLRLLHKPSLLIAASTLVAGTLMVASQWDVASHSTLLLWVTTLFSAAAIRLSIFFSFSRSDIQSQQMWKWKTMTIAATWLVGSIWGWLGYFHFPADDPLHLLTMLLILIGLAAGSITTLSPLRSASLPFVLLLLSPVTYHLFSLPSTSLHFISFLFIFYLCFLIGSALQNYQTHKDNISLRIESSEREKAVRASEKELQLSEEKFRTLTEHGSDIVSTINRNGIISFSSRSAERILGYSSQTLIGQSLFELVHEDDRPGLIQAITEMFANPGKSIPAAFRIRHRLGRWLSIESIGRTTGDHGQETLILNARDVTAHKELELQLHQSQKMEAIGTLVGGIAHNFNNNLAAMTGNIYLARLSSQDNSNTLKRLDSLDLLASRSADMIKQLLAFARQDRLSMKPLRLNRLLNHDIALTANLIQESIELRLDICTDEIMIRGDASQIQQALINLLINARDAVATIENPEILCSLQRYQADHAFHHRHPEIKGEQFARLSVQDNGCGIPGDALGKIFEPFYTTKDVDKGTGLGLAMVYGAIQAHGGVIDVTSSPHAGTTIDMYLPMIQEQEARNEEAGHIAPSIHHGAGETILLVDDDTTVLHSTREVLLSLGFRVITAEHGIAALEQFEQQPESIRLLLTDIVMPKMGGIALAQAIRQRNNHLPVIFATGYDRKEALDAEAAISHSSVLSKPFSISRLSQAIHDSLLSAGQEKG
ncbi:response regulator [Mariprofundus erugo]|uniref:hybrid sensor histidine kinase/response regulator n=1 Tax=Mariprofundus erugo TaxID=2528639 RepID=UPI0010FE2089|nr:ATP-binding protein [Mariprofundus erugo]TLS77661.1 response regulator [Mariprofundus erugo]